MTPRDEDAPPVEVRPHDLGPDPRRPHPTDGPYVERFWLPVLGPTAIALARLAMTPCARDGLLVCEETTGMRSWLGAKPAAVRRAAVRLVDHGFAEWWSPTVLAVFSCQQDIGPRAVERVLPDTLRRAVAYPEAVGS